MTVSCLNHFSDEVLKHFIGFFFGLLAASLIRFGSSKLRLLDQKKFINGYLKGHIKPQLELLKMSYLSGIEPILNDQIEAQVIDAFENFHIVNLLEFGVIDLHKIFGDNFNQFLIINSNLDFLSKNLPHQVIENHWNEFNSHLREQTDRIDEHVRDCQRCEKRRKDSVKILNMRIEEVTKLEKDIDEYFITNKSFCGSKLSHYWNRVMTRR